VYNAYPLHSRLTLSLFYVQRAHLHLPSFPTRRSSDLSSCRCRSAGSRAHRRLAGVAGKFRRGGGRGARVDSSMDRLRQVCCAARSEEHTSELQSRGHLVCRLLLEKKKRNLSLSRPSRG